MPTDRPAREHAPNLVPAVMRRRELVVAVSIVVLPIVLAAVHVLQTRYFPASDVAIIQLDLAHAQRGIPLTGVYSRFGFRHPGPALYAWLAPFWHTFAGEGLVVGAAAWNALNAAAIVLLFARRGGRWLLLCGTVVLWSLELGVLSDLVSPWNPWMVLLPTCLLLLVTWETLAGSAYFCAAVVGVASVVVQFHIGLAPLGAVACVAATVRAALAPRKAGERGGSRWRPLMYAGVVAALLWAAPLLEQLAGNPGNFTKIADAMSHPSEPIAGPAVGLDATRQALAWPPPWFDTPESNFAGQPVAPSVWRIVPFGVGLVVALWCAARDRVGRIPLAVGVGAVIVGWAACSRITGPALFYVIRWTWIPAALLWVVMCWLVGRRLASAPAIQRRWPGMSRVGAGTAAAVLAAAAVSLVVARDVAPPDAVGSTLVDRVIDPVAAAARRDSPIGTRLVGETLQGAGIGIVAELDRRGFAVYVPDEYETSVGVDRVRAGREVGQELTVSVSYRDVFLDTSDPLVAAWDPLTPTLRAEVSRLEQLHRDVLTGTVPRTAMSAVEVARREELIGRGPAIAVYLGPRYQP